MRIIISPAKTMNYDPDTLEYKTLPVFLREAGTLREALRERTYEECQNIWCCSDKLATLNYDRLQCMDLCRGLTPAVISFDGIQYRYMSPSILNDDALEYMDEHLRILSGFYGVLRPFDGVVPYRLEMKSKGISSEIPNLYDFWGGKLASYICHETDCILNLASKEYSHSIYEYLPKEVRCITCIFGERRNGRIRESGTKVKMARGAMVRFMAEHKITDPEDIKEFREQDYVFDPTVSDSNMFVFIKK